ncbi:cbb3-type cytochrome c oxidase subunit CcoQ [Alcanivorax xiamenensis]|uniref:Cbb3-type cytochrome c oxidase subunit CcoQ n=1 Tax=Alcanivorax xiamenensis TaxID=1177156 RepID=A0ABQ6YA86_9GAMM|nr:MULTISPECIES: cbb3-type cytochrome c oxidase subunit 3 [Alcanivorax]KAF0806308.1 cbb3-type cytochrome c oxidase subunit CcoQ [Alcanivorax xiamenensis]
MTYHSVLTVLFFLAFLALVAWVYRPGRKQQYQELAQLPVRDDQQARAGSDGEQGHE